MINWEKSVKLPAVGNNTAKLGRSGLLTRLSTKRKKKPGSSSEHRPGANFVACRIREMGYRTGSISSQFMPDRSSKLQSFKKKNLNK